MANRPGRRWMLACVAERAAEGKELLGWGLSIWGGPDGVAEADVNRHCVQLFAANEGLECVWVCRWIPNEAEVQHAAALLQSSNGDITQLTHMQCTERAVVR